MSINLSAVKQHLQNNRYWQLDSGLIAVLICFILLAWVNWGKLETPIIDIGREVEISARLADGQVLYRDVATYYGPLAYYVNAFILLIFGHRLEVFYAVGVGLSLIAALLFYRLAKRLTNANWAVICTLSMLVYCALGPGIFNFIMPYSFGAVYAIVLSLIAIACLDLYVSENHLKWLVVAAIACGLAGLAKQEYGVAVLGSVIVGINLNTHHKLGNRILRSLLVILIASICVFLPLALLAHSITWEKLYLSLFPVGQANILQRNLAFQVSPFKTIIIWWIQFRSFFVSSLVIAVAVLAAHWLAKLKFLYSFQWISYLIELAISVTLAWLGLNLLTWLIFIIYKKQYFPFHPLQNLSWFILIAGIWLALILFKKYQQKNNYLLGTLLFFSLLLNARWGFYIDFYGLYAAPVILTLFTFFYSFSQKIRWFFYRCLLICLLLGSFFILENTLNIYQYRVNSDHGTFYTTNSTVATALNQTIKTINTSDAKSVLVLPEGNILNFLTKTHSPSRELTFLPVTLANTKEEQDFLERMRSNPPEIIVYIHRSFEIWNYRKYADFNPLIDNWITQKHKLIHTFELDEGEIRIFGK